MVVRAAICATRDRRAAHGPAIMLVIPTALVVILRRTPAARSSAHDDYGDRAWGRTRRAGSRTASLGTTVHVSRSSASFHEGRPSLPEMVHRTNLVSPISGVYATTSWSCGWARAKGRCAFRGLRVRVGAVKPRDARGW